MFKNTFWYMYHIVNRLCQVLNLILKLLAFWEVKLLFDNLVEKREKIYFGKY